MYKPREPEDWDFESSTRPTPKPPTCSIWRQHRCSACRARSKRSVVRPPSVLCSCNASQHNCMLGTQKFHRNYAVTLQESVHFYGKIPAFQIEPKLYLVFKSFSVTVQNPLTINVKGNSLQSPSHYQYPFRLQFRIVILRFRLVFGFFAGTRFRRRETKADRFVSVETGERLAGMLGLLGKPRR